MKIDNDNSTAVNQGFSQQDQNYLRMFDNAEAGPEWQLLTEEDWEDDEPEQRDYFCAICKSSLDNLEGTETIWICSNCSQTYDTSIQDAPIKDLNESKVKTYPELGKYPTFDERDVILPFVEGIDPDADGDNISGKISQEVKCLVWLYDVSIRNADIITSDSGYEEYYTEGDLYFHECTNVDLFEFIPDKLWLRASP